MITSLNPPRKNSHLSQSRKPDRKRFLIADDHELIRRALRHYLVRCFPRCSVTEASDFRETMERIAGGPPDVVFLDLQMPSPDKLNAFEVIASIRRMYPELPVLVLSGDSEEASGVSAIIAGASGFLTKTAISDDIKEAVSTVLAGRRFLSKKTSDLLLEKTLLKSSALPLAKLSNRELQVLRLISENITIKEIAFNLGVSDKTVGTYRDRIYEKTGTNSLVAITRYAIEHKLLK